MIGVALHGIGHTADLIAEQCGTSEIWSVRAGVTGSPHKIGSDRIGAEIVGELDVVLARPDVDVVIHTGLEHGDALAEVLGRCVDAGKDAVTVAGLVHPDVELGDAAATALRRRAMAGGGRIVGTGVNPGLLLDVLPTLVTTLFARPRSVVARRASEMRHWGDGALRGQGGVLQPAGTPWEPGGLTLMPSARLVADALGGAPDLTESVERLMSDRERSDGGRSIGPGEPMGFRRVVQGRVNGTELYVEWLAGFCLDDPPSARVEIDGLELVLRGDPLDDSHPATAARALRALAPLRLLPPGLYRPDQLPISGAEVSCGS